jgi:hypothetical protein
LAGPELNLESIRGDYQIAKVSGQVATRTAYHYLRVRQWVIKYKNVESTVAVAFQIARQPSQSYLGLMKNGGTSLGLLLPIAMTDDQQDKTLQHDAAYEALILVTRMPLDHELFRVGDQLSNLLANGLKSDQATSEEVFLISELLSMYSARKLGEFKILAGMRELPGEDLEWRNDLTIVRIGLAACAQRVIDVPPQSRSALSRGLGVKWLYAVSIVGWDLALSETVNASNSSEDCKKFASQFKSMTNFSSKD